MILRLTKVWMVWYDRNVPKVILYPTETVYGLGVNPLDERAWRLMCDIKGRPDTKPASWLVKGVSEIHKFAVVPEYAKELIDKYLPGPVTFILKAKDTVPEYAQAKDGTVSFRVSSDVIAQELINGLDHPLTCTSANLAGASPLPTPEEILRQLGQEAALITDVYDDGSRDGLPSTIVRCVDAEPEILRQGSIEL